jgi:hypothetical protein
MLPVVLYAICRFSCLNGLLMDRVPVPKYVSMIHFLWESLVRMSSFCCFSMHVLRESSIFRGNPLALAICFMVFHSLCFRVLLSGSEFMHCRRSGMQLFCVPRGGWK